MVWVRCPVYFYKRGETSYFSRAVPSDLQNRFDKRKVEVSLRTKSEPRARQLLSLFTRPVKPWCIASEFTSHSAIAFC